MSNYGVIVHAESINDESSATYSWSEMTEKEKMRMDITRYEPTWVKTDDKDVSVSGGTINLKSYVMTLLNDTKLCKGETTHSSYFRGYVRARFETVFGAVITGSDSERKYSYYGNTAETPSNTETVGWNGIAHTYCGI